MCAKIVYDHLFPELKGYNLPYTAQGGGPRKSRPLAPSSRSSHAGAILQSLSAIVAQQEDRIAELSPHEPGFHVTARARTEAGLDIDSFKGRGGVAEILSRAGDGLKERANLFLPQARLAEFQSRLQKYPTFEPQPKVKSPPSFWFFESLGQLDGTVLADLWTDPSHDFPQSPDVYDWELWVKSEAASQLRALSGRFSLRFELGAMEFPGVTLLRALATPGDLERAALATGAILELRACSSLTLQVLDMPRAAQRSLNTDVLKKITLPPVDAARICILDTGVDHSHPLLSPALPASRCQTLNPAWAVNGWDAHGTRVAGLALYKNLELLIGRAEPYALQNNLESVTVLRPHNGPKATNEAVGVIAQAVSMVEAEPARRVFCLAFADASGSNDGSQTPLSGNVDQLAFGVNGSQRLFCVAAGNLDDDPVRPSGYTKRNEQSGIASPGQSLNALTVGGCTFVDDHPHDGAMFCGAGDLSPTSRTTRSWTVRKSTKPDVVFEAGNLGVAPDIDQAEDIAELGILTTTKMLEGHFATLKETSAATAAVAGIAGRLWQKYPQYWPESVRGMIVHSASWTEAMLKRVAAIPDKHDRMDALLTMFGWGVPDEIAACESASDHVTMVIQDELAPFTVVDKEIRSDAILYYELPWPKAALAEIGDTDVELRVTLSYFVDPNLRASAVGDHANYASHRFTFDLKGPHDDHFDTVRRKNKAFKSNKPLPTRSESGWEIGPTLRDRGAIHHDRWRGKASDLALQDGIRIIPRSGWWADQISGEYADVPARFSLIMSIKTPMIEKDIYALVRSRAAVLNRNRNPALTRLEARQPIITQIP